uniref:Uncharacterized protein n=1 Tax=Ananas comosus var. bracteatus TaxID=296719 RepID=A0A6V7Q3L7_ANACO|nr:unnamed protein product [Ananas comosus var. bracteatus]
MVKTERGVGTDVAPLPTTRIPTYAAESSSASFVSDRERAVVSMPAARSSSHGFPLPWISSSPRPSPSPLPSPPPQTLARIALQNPRISLLAFSASHRVGAATPVEGAGSGAHPRRSREF